MILRCIALINYIHFIIPTMKATPVPHPLTLGIAISVIPPPTPCHTFINLNISPHHHYNKASSTLCHPCQLGKHIRFPFLLLNLILFARLELKRIHCDIWTSPVPNTSGYRYTLVILDDFTYFFGAFPFWKIWCSLYFCCLSCLCLYTTPTTHPIQSIMTVDENFVTPNLASFVVNMALFSISHVPTHLHTQQGWACHLHDQQRCSYTEFSSLSPILVLGWIPMHIW
jgi:hypothetical protein